MSTTIVTLANRRAEIKRVWEEGTTLLAVDQYQLDVNRTELHVRVGGLVQGALDAATAEARSGAQGKAADKAAKTARADLRKAIVEDDGVANKSQLSTFLQVAALVRHNPKVEALAWWHARALVAFIDEADGHYSIDANYATDLAEIIEATGPGHTEAEVRRLARAIVFGEDETPPPQQAQPNGNGETTTPATQPQPANDGDPDLEDQGKEQEADEELPPSYANLPANSAARTAAEILRVSEDRAAAYRGLGQITEGDDVAQVVRGFADWLESEHIVDATPQWHALVRQIAEQGARLVANSVIERVTKEKQVA